MKIEYGKYPLQVKWFRRRDHVNSGHLKLYMCKEDDCCAELYVFSTERRGSLFSPIISLKDKVDIVAEIILFITDNSNPINSTEPVDISIQQVTEQIEKIREEDWYFEADAFEIFDRKNLLSDRDCKDRRILRLYKFKDL